MIEKWDQLFFASQFRRIGKGRFHVFRSQRWVASKNILRRRAFRQVIQNDGHGNSRTARTQISPTNTGIADKMIGPHCHALILKH